MEPAQEDPRVGTVLNDRYRILERLASGGMGVVYRAERLRLGRPVAIKFLHSLFAQDTHIVGRFEREARAMSRLSHPHCVSVIDFGIEEAPFIVMDFVTGDTLKDLLEQGRLPTPRALTIGRQILAGLAHAHGQGIIHRDIKPANIMLTEATGTGDHVRILDFGLAKLYESGTAADQSMASMVVGTPSYMSPEQARGEAVDARSDVYSSGVLLYELLTGAKPFFADEAFEVLRMHKEEEAPPLRNAAPAVEYSDELEAVIARALAKAPDDRFQSAVEFAEALDRVPEAATRMRSSMGTPVPDSLPYARTEAIRASTPPPSLQSQPPAVASAPPRKGVSPLLVILLLAAVAGAAYVFVWKPRQDGAAAGAADAGAGAGETTTAAATPETEMKFTPEETEPLPAPPELAERPDAAGADAPGVDAAPPDAFAADAEIYAPPEELPEELDDTEVGEAVEPEEIGEAPPPPDPPEPRAEAPRPVTSVADVRRLIAEGKREGAISGLLALRRQQPRNAQIPYLLGNLYYDKLWWSDALSRYQEAIKKNRGYKRNRILNHNVIRMLGSQKTYRKSRTMILRVLGKSSLPHLRRAAKSDKNPKVRQRAQSLIKTLTRR